MTEFLDELARTMARPVPRRRALRLLGTSLIAAAVPLARPGLRPARAARFAPTACGDPNLCPGPDRTKICGCEVTEPFVSCFKTCCDPKTQACCLYPPGPGSTAPCEKICCPLDTTECGTTYGCVPKCPADRKCGDECCPADQECVQGKCEYVCKKETARGVSRVYDPKTQCCTDFGIERKYPIRYYTRCQKTRVARPGYKPTWKGCGAESGPKVPDSFGKASFLKACNAHDLCYDKCRSDREACDAKFCRQLKAACRRAYPEAKSKMRIKCDNRAELYCDGVVALGSVAYVDAQSKACQCCP